MCDPILVTVLKMQPHYSQSSRENATPSSGTSLVASYKEVPPPPGGMCKPPKVVIPNSMWTAGCCFNGTTLLGSFAVIGNNVPNKGKIEMSQVTVDKLESIIGYVDLVPANDDCQNKKKNDVNI